MFSGKVSEQHTSTSNKSFQSFNVKDKKFWNKYFSIKADQCEFLLQSDKATKNIVKRQFFMFLKYLQSFQLRIKILVMTAFLF